MEEKGAGNPPAKYISTKFTFEDGVKIKDLTDLSVSLYNEDVLLVKNTLNSKGFAEHADIDTISTSFILETEGNNEFAWNRGAYGGDQPTDIVIEYTISGKKYKFVSNSVPTIT